jgi:hypothetical protein
MRAAEQKDIELRVARRSAFQTLGNFGPAQSASNNELSALSPGWAGGIKPPNGGNKIRSVIQRFRGAFGKCQKMPPSIFNSLAVVSKKRKQSSPEDQSRKIWDNGLRACRLRRNTPPTVRTGGRSTASAVRRFEPMPTLTADNCRCCLWGR